MSLYALIFLLVWGFLVSYLGKKYHLHLRNFGVVVGFVTLLLLVFILTFPVSLSGGCPVLPKNFLMAHALFGFFSCSILALAFCTAVIYVLQERLLKNKDVHLLSERLPSLEALEGIMVGLVWLGVLLLAMGIIMGAFWSKLIHESYFRFKPKEVWAILTWIAYAGYLGLYHLTGLGRHKKVYLLIIATILVILLYLGRVFLV